MNLKKLNYDGEYALELQRIYGTMTDKIMGSESVSMDKLERTFRKAAISCGRLELSNFLSEIAEQQPICHNCGSKMRNIDKREKQIITLLGSCKYSRSYYGCYCGAHAIPKDESLGVFAQNLHKQSNE